MLKKALIALFLTLTASPVAHALTRGLPDPLAHALGPAFEALAPCREIPIPGGGTLYAIPTLKITLAGKGIPPASRTFPLTCYRLTPGAETPLAFAPWIGKDAAPTRDLLRAGGIPLPTLFGLPGETLAEEEIPPPARLTLDWAGRFNPDNASHWARIADLYASLGETVNAFHAIQQAYMRHPRRLNAPAADAYLATLPYPNTQAALVTLRTLNKPLANSYLFQSELFTPQMLLFEKSYHRGVLGFRKEAYRLLPYTLETFTPDLIPEKGHDLIGVNWVSKFFIRAELLPDLTGQCGIYQPNEKGNFEKTDSWIITGRSTLTAIPSTLRDLPTWKTFLTDYGIPPGIPVWILNEPGTFLLYPFPAQAPRHTIALILHAEAASFTVWPFFDLRHLPEAPGESTL